MHNDVQESPRTVALDASVLLNFLNLGREELLTKFKDLDWVIPQPVEQEVMRPLQRQSLRDAIEAGLFRRVPVQGMRVTQRYLALRQRFGQGESSCLALAENHGWLMACDERGALFREMDRKLGQERILNTPGLFCLAIQRGLLTVEQADRLKQELEDRHRFRMKVASFRDLF